MKANFGPFPLWMQSNNVEMQQQNNNLFASLLICLFEWLMWDVSHPPPSFLSIYYIVFLGWSICFRCTHSQYLNQHNN